MWLGGERGEQAVPGGDAARRLPQRDLVVGAAERVGEAHGKLLLAGAEFRVILLGKHALGDQGLDHLRHDGRRRVHPDRREARAVIEGNVLPVLLPGQRELVLEGRLEHEALRGRAPDHPFEEAPRTGVPRRPLERRHVAEQPGGVRRVGQDRERPWIGREPDLADRPERALGHELVQHVERLHGDGEPDTGLEVGGQEPRVAGLAANDAVVAAVEEAHELDLGGAAFAHDATVLAVGALGLGAWRGHEGTPSPCAQRRGVQLLKRSRRTFLSNLPTLVLGTASMSRTSSGNAHLASLGRR